MNKGILESNKSCYSYPIELLGQSNIMPMPDDHWHPDAVDWRSRVVANGGNVPYSTMTAVSKFCRTIDATGLRDKFYRLNLFCGNSLLSCVVPLYRGPSLLGPRYGNITDTNINFLSSDYNSIGNNRGLKSNRNKHLRTGLSASVVGRDVHIAYFASYQNPVHTYGFCIGASTSGNTRQTSLVQWVNAGQWQFINGANNGFCINATVVPPPFFLLGSTPNSGPSILVMDGAVSTGNIGGQVPTEQDFYVFDENRGGSGSGGFGTDGRLTFYSIGKSLNFQQSQMLRSAVIAINSDLGVTIPVVSNPDAQSWINRVYFNGGEVSNSTASAVNQFCNEIDAAGLRDRFVRLNLFCGSNLSACLVPLYRATSVSATQLGNATDTNSNFVAGDYVERGNTGGLLGNGRNKQLDVGLTPDQVGASTGHMSAYIPLFVDNANNRRIMGAGTLSPASMYGLQVLTDGNINGDYMNRTLGAPLNNGHYIITRISINDASLYQNGSLVSRDTFDATSSTSTFDIRIFAINFSNSITNLWPSRILSYSVGASMTDSQSLSYYNALQNFQTLLGRNL